jgi:hypothetical protein
MCMSMEGYGVDVTICRDLKRRVCNACDKVAGRTGGYVAVGLTWLNGTLGTSEDFSDFKDLPWELKEVRGLEGCNYQ